MKNEQVLININDEMIFNGCETAVFFFKMLSKLINKLYFWASFVLKLYEEIPERRCSWIMPYWCRQTGLINFGIVLFFVVCFFAHEKLREDVVISCANFLIPFFFLSFAAFFVGGVGGFGVTAGAHRFWCHRAYKAKLPLRIILMLSYCVAGQVFYIFHTFISPDFFLFRFLFLFWLNFFE